MKSSHTSTPAQSADTVPTELQLFDSAGRFVRPPDEDIVLAGWPDEKLDRYQKVRDAAITREEAEQELFDATLAFNKAQDTRVAADAALRKVRPRLTQRDLVEQMKQTDRMR